jgi:MFS family permease
MAGLTCSDPDSISYDDGDSPPDAGLLPLPPSVNWATARFGGLPRSFWFLWTGTIVNKAGTFITPFLTLYLTGERHVSVQQAGLVLACLGLGSAIGQPLGGVLADRIGRRRTMVLGLLLSAVTLLTLGAASRLAVVAVAAFAYGLCLDLFRPAVQAAVADLVSDADRPRAFALQFWASNLGFSIATPLGGYLATRGFWLLFVLDAIASVAFALLILRGVPDTRSAVAGAVGHVREVLSDTLMLSVVACSLAMWVVYMQAYVTLPLAFAADDLGPGTYGAAIALNGVLIIVLQPLVLGRLSRWRRGPLLLVAMLLEGLGFGLTVFADSVPMHLLAIAVWTAGEVFAAGQLAGLVVHLAPLHLRGRYLGTFGFAFGAAALLAPLVGTQVLARAGEPVLWSGSLVLCALAGVGLLRLSAAAERRPGSGVQPMPVSRCGVPRQRREEPTP